MLSRKLRIPSFARRYAFILAILGTIIFISVFRSPAPEVKHTSGELIQSADDDPRTHAVLNALRYIKSFIDASYSSDSDIQNVYKESTLLLHPSGLNSMCKVSLNCS
jgi:hypothetical protein